MYVLFQLLGSNIWTLKLDSLLQCLSQAALKVLARPKFSQCSTTQHVSKNQFLVVRRTNSHFCYLPSGALQCGGLFIKTWKPNGNRTPLLARDKRHNLFLPNRESKPYHHSSSVLINSNYGEEITLTGEYHIVAIIEYQLWELPSIKPIKFVNFLYFLFILL